MKCSGKKCFYASDYPVGVTVEQKLRAMTTPKMDSAIGCIVYKRIWALTYEPQQGLIVISPKLQMGCISYKTGVGRHSREYGCLYVERAFNRYSNRRNMENSECKLGSRNPHICKNNKYHLKK